MSWLIINEENLYGVLRVDFNIFERFINIYGIIQRKLKETQIYGLQKNT